MKNIFLIIALTVLFLSCDEVGNPYDGAGTGTGDPGGETGGQRVLLMEFTGIRCPNCPEASAKAKELINDNNDNVFGLNVHASGLATPANSSEPDFRSLDANQLYLNAGRPALPTALINFIPDGTAGKVENFGSWEGLITQELAKTPSAELTISVEEMGGNEFKAIVEYYYYGEVFQEDNLALYITEDKIVGFQLDGSNRLTDYEHNFVFRKAINTPFGEELDNSTIETSQRVTREFTFSIEQEWVAENVNVIAVLFDRGDSFRIRQVNESDIIETE